MVHTSLPQAKGFVAGDDYILKFGTNLDIDTGGFEDVWEGGGEYTGFNAIEAQTLQVFSSDVADTGTELSSGTATSGSRTTLVDTGADFYGDGVAVGDLLINDSFADHGVITAVTATMLTVRRMRFHSLNVVGNSYRVATAASTGLAAVRLNQLLDGNYAVAVPEYVILNGTTPVDTAGDYLRHSRTKGLIAGSANGNVGVITSRQKVTTANVFTAMIAGYNQTMIACWTVPAGYTGFMETWFAALTKKNAAYASCRLRCRPVGEVFHDREQFAVASTGTSFQHREFAIPKGPFMEMTDIKVSADSSANDVGIAAGFDMTITDGIIT